MHRWNNTKLSDASSTSEIHKSEEINLKVVQKDFFKDEYKWLIKGEEIKDEQLKEFNSSLNSRSLIRDGERLKNAGISYNQKHLTIQSQDLHISDEILRKYYCQWTLRSRVCSFNHP